MFKLSDKLIERAEENEFSLNIDYENGNIEVFKTSSAGQDFGFYVDLGENKKEFLSNIYDYYENFDVDEEASLWIGEDGHGKNGAPYYITDIIADMEECKEFINEFYNIVNQS